MKIRVYVLTQQGCDNQDNDTLEVVGVFSTKTKAKEKMSERMNDIRDYYFDNFTPDEYSEYEEGWWTCWGISLKDAPVYDELLITEKIIDQEED